MLKTFKEKTEAVKKSTLLITFFFLHVPLIYVMSVLPFTVPLHGLATLAVGLYFSIIKKDNEKVTITCAYIMGAEVFWRMLGGAFGWEFAKYAIIILTLVSIVKNRMIKIPPAPMFYLLLLLPSVVVTFLNAPPDLARSEILSALSGPIALASSLIYFSQTRISKATMDKILQMFLIPILAMSVNVLTKITKVNISYFSTESNFALSGGFGPNQVSAVFGLGALMAFLWLLTVKKQDVFERVLMISISMLLIGQAALTFSRGGVYMAVSGAFAALMVSIKDRKTLFRTFTIFLAIAAIVYYIVFPFLDSYTGGAIVQRYQSITLTNRREIMESDLKIWQDNMLFGVGPGESKNYRSGELSGVMFHTEYTRMLAEHGLLGLAAMVMMFVMLYDGYKKSNGIKARAVSISFIVWSVLDLSANAIRIAAPAFLLGLACAEYDIEDQPDTEKSLK